MSLQSLSVPDLKTQAKSLRAALAASGKTVSHSQSLELMAKQHGFHDWNTLHAHAAKNVSFALGQRVSGTYLGQPFRGKVIGIRALAGGVRFGLTIRFDDPVDVVMFEGLSNLRSQVQAVVNAEGVSAEKTSDGAPHLRVRPERD